VAKAKEPRRFSDEAVKAKTGKVWAEWFKILDAAGAKKMNHPEMARYLYHEQKVPGWWCQMLAVEYEQKHGLREIHQTCNGDFAAGVSRTLPIPLAKIYKAWADENARKAWLKDDKMEITTATANKSIRAKWDETDRMSVYFYPKGADKTQVVVDHMKLKSAAESKRMKDFWAEAVARLESELAAK
jgi:phenylpropionate dioxygenase-like ring-hydroxylating dioxygenase large terminal subunit